MGSLKFTVVVVAVLLLSSLLQSSAAQGVCGGSGPRYCYGAYGDAQCKNDCKYKFARVILDISKCRGEMCLCYYYCDKATTVAPYEI
ncbi:unnamed protein product [Microthlaspi erraticum]|uniref:Knottin scorpion toxin-like domain-containing protein n=1 Tax=Microthlaspi erraticum TaxID=1685480 RepID=A0A6D2J7A0_9BRAS|nr:unnamed protein product [Microthlaspi erraticum]